MSKRKNQKAPAKALGFNVDMDALGDLNMVGLLNLRRVLHHVGEQLSAFGCQPRFGRDANRRSAAGIMVAELCEFIALYEGAVVEAGRWSEPESASETAARNWLMVGFETDCQDSMADLAVMVAQAVADETNAAATVRAQRLIAEGRA